MELYRKVSRQIKDWYDNSNKALLIKGARQTGKTHVIRTTLDEMGSNYIEINLIEHRQQYRFCKALLRLLN